MKDYYAILGVTPSADGDVISAAYRVLAKKYHPDSGSHGGTASLEKFREIQDAFETLGNPASRAEYDAARNESGHEDEAILPAHEHQSAASTEQPPIEPIEAGKQTSKLGSGHSRVLSAAAVIVALASIAISAHLYLKDSRSDGAGADGVATTQSVAENAASPSSNSAEKASLTGPERPITPDAGATQDIEKGLDGGAEGSLKENVSGLPQRKQDYSRIIGSQAVEGQRGTQDALPRIELATGSLYSKQDYSRITGDQEVEGQYTAIESSIPPDVQRDAKEGLPWPSVGPGGPDRLSPSQ